MLMSDYKKIKRNRKRTLLIVEVNHEKNVLFYLIFKCFPELNINKDDVWIYEFEFEKDKIFNASTCGDNCAKWLLKIAASQDRTINLHHLMEFGEEPFQIRILNTDQVVCSMRELISIAGEFV